MSWEDVNFREYWFLEGFKHLLNCQKMSKDVKRSDPIEVDTLKAFIFCWLLWTTACSPALPALNVSSDVVSLLQNPHLHVWHFSFSFEIYSKLTYFGQKTILQFGYFTDCNLNVQVTSYMWRATFFLDLQQVRILWAQTIRKCNLNVLDDLRCLQRLYLHV